MLKQSKFLKVDTTPTPIGRRARTPTEANENLSEVDIDRVLENRRGLNISESTQGVEDRRNENLSNYEYSGRTCGRVLYMKLEVERS